MNVNLVWNQDPLHPPVMLVRVSAIKGIHATDNKSDSNQKCFRQVAILNLAVHNIIYKSLLIAYYICDEVF